MSEINHSQPADGAWIFQETVGILAPCMEAADDRAFDLGMSTELPQQFYHIDTTGMADASTRLAESWNGRDDPISWYSANTQPYVSTHSNEYSDIVSPILDETGNGRSGGVQDLWLGSAGQASQTYPPHFAVHFEANQTADLSAAAAFSSIEFSDQVEEKSATRRTPLSKGKRASLRTAKLKERATLETHLKIFESSGICRCFDVRTQNIPLKDRKHMISFLETLSRPQLSDGDDESTSRKWTIRHAGQGTPSVNYRPNEGAKYVLSDTQDALERSIGIRENAGSKVVKADRIGWNSGCDTSVNTKGGGLRRLWIVVTG